MNENNQRLRDTVATAAGSPVLRTVVRCLIGCAITALTDSINSSRPGTTSTAATCLSPTY